MALSLQTLSSLALLMLKVTQEYKYLQDQGLEQLDVHVSNGIL